MLLVCLIWGINFSVVKSALGAMPALAFTALRFLLSSVVLWLILRWQTGRVAFPKGSVWQLVVLGILGNTIYQAAFTVGLAHTSATNSALIISTVPSVVVALGALLGIERPTRRMVIGVVLGTAGVVLVIAAKGVSFDRSTLTGDLLSVAALFCWAGYTLGVRRLPKEITPLEVTALTTFTGTPGLVLAGLPDLLKLRWTAMPLAVWGSMAYASILSLGVAYVIWNTSIQRVGSSRTAIYMCVTPIVATVAAWIILGEHPVPLQGVGAALIFAGVVLSRRERVPYSRSTISL
jgi:drug/metabolite transporter (DMT)-like permease